MIAGKVHYNHLICRSGENLTGEMSAVNAIGDFGNSGFQIEFAPILFDTGMTGKFQPDIPGSFIGHLADRIGHHFSPDQVVRFPVPAFEDQSPGFGQGLQRFGIIRIVGASGVQGVLVQLQPLDGRAPENHRAQSPVADRQSLHPLTRRLLIPEQKPLRIRAGILDCFHIDSFQTGDKRQNGAR